MFDQSVLKSILIVVAVFVLFLFWRWSVKHKEQALIAHKEREEQDLPMEYDGRWAPWLFGSIVIVIVLCAFGYAV